MTRKWLNSADVEISDKGALSVQQAAPSSFSGGIKTIADAATAQKLVANATPCLGVWFGARIDASGNALNTKPVFIGESAAKASAAEGGVPVKSDDAVGFYWAIDDASKLYVKVGVNNEGVAYRIIFA